ncbi:MAG: sigma-70 family RNA polymerase sigma factor [Acidobacteriota bacterium]
MPIESELRERVTTLLDALDRAGLGAETDRPIQPEALMAEVYDELRRVAASYLRHERANHTLEPTALVHEAYMRLVDGDRVSYNGRSHFFAIGARVMRRLLVDHARKKGSQKRGGDWHQVTLDRAADPLFGREYSAEEILALDEALDRLARSDPRPAQVVELRWFGGLEVAEVARHLGVSKRTIEGDWAYARAWLARELEP